MSNTYIKISKIYHEALYGIATVIFLGIWTLNVTNLSRNEDTKCHKRYHTGKNPSVAEYVGGRSAGVEQMAQKKQLNSPHYFPINSGATISVTQYQYLARHRDLVARADSM